MKTYQGINVKSNKAYKTILNKLFLTLHAEGEGGEGGENTDPTPKTNPVNYEDLIAKARAEEKSKLYKQMDNKDKKIADLTEKNNALMLKVGQLEGDLAIAQKDLEGAKKDGKVIESEEVARLNKEVETLKAELETTKSNTPNVEEIETRVKSEYEVKMYRMEKLHEVGNAVIPELVMGTTKEEIDASLELSKNRYSEIVGNLGQSQKQVTVPTGNINLGQLSTSTINPDDIMNMSAKEWAEQRAKYGLV